jgi:hypothetical protein
LNLIWKSGEVDWLICKNRGRRGSRHIRKYFFYLAQIRKTIRTLFLFFQLHVLWNLFSNSKLTSSEFFGTSGPRFPRQLYSSGTNCFWNALFHRKCNSSSSMRKRTDALALPWKIIDVTNVNVSKLVHKQVSKYD